MVYTNDPHATKTISKDKNKLRNDQKKNRVLPLPCAQHKADNG
jgi:hypothetical protein